MKDANLADIKVVRYVLQRFGIRAKHRLGQNFLVRPILWQKSRRQQNWQKEHLFWKSVQV